MAVNSKGKQKKAGNQQRMSHDIPHPLAGRTGQGPPFAPKDWKWKAGRRLSDMYFCSPQGARLRSQIQLHEYLATLTDPPSPSEFVWRVHPDGEMSCPLFSSLGSVAFEANRTAVGETCVKIVHISFL